jgi:hypothetical protein
VLADRKQPEVGETWQHWRGENYRILAVAESTLNKIPFQIVVYQSLKTEEIWCQSLAEFMTVQSADEDFYWFEQVT